MQFRIRTLMSLVVSASILLAVWHLIPLGRSGLLYYALAAVLIAPVMYLVRTRPAPWSTRRKAGFVAFALLVGIIYMAFIGWTIVYDPGLAQRMATWPG